MNLDNETGISIMKIIPKLDAGPVMMKSKVEISYNTNYENLSNKLSLLEQKSIIKSLDLIEKKKLFLKSRMKMMLLMQKKLKKKQKIDWNKEAKKLLQKLMVYIQNLDVGLIQKV